MSPRRDPDQNGGPVQPLTLIVRFRAKEASGEFGRIGEQAGRFYRNQPEIDPYERLAQLAATKAKLTDKMTLMKAIIGHTVGVDSLGDDDAFTILAGWAVAEYRRREDNEKPATITR